MTIIMRLAMSYSLSEIRSISPANAVNSEVLLALTGKRYLWNPASLASDTGDGAALKPTALQSWQRGRWIREALGGSGGSISLPIQISDVSSLQSALNALQAGVQAASETFSAENKDSVEIKQGQAVAIHSSGTGVVLANATAPGKEAVGLATEDIAVGFSGVVLVDGPMTLADWTDVIGAVSPAARATYWLDTTNGKLTTAAPAAIGNISQMCAVELAADKLQICIRYPILL